MMRPPTNEELGLDENGFPPTDDSGNVDLEQIRYHLSLTPAQRLQQLEGAARFGEELRQAGERYYVSVRHDTEAPE